MYSKNKIGGTGTENFSFASLGAVLQIVFNTTAENVTLKSITIKDDNATLSGTFTVDKDGKASITATDKAGITLNLGTGKALGKGANYFNIAVPAGTYSNLSITFTATDNTVCTMKGSVTLNHNTVGKLTLTGFTPTAGCATADGVGYVKWVQLWAGGPKFAEFNVGATLATEYGGYYTWGGTYKNGKDDWTDDHNTANTGSGNLSGTDDTATKLWGSNWRMPTTAELQALLANCTVEWTTVGGVSGRKFTGRGAYSSNSVFLPAAGYSFNGYVLNQGSYGNYWSSTPNGSSGACILDFGSVDQNVKNDYNRRNIGYSVRAVLNESAE